MNRLEASNSSRAVQIRTELVATAGGAVAGGYGLARVRRKASTAKLGEGATMHGVGDIGKAVKNKKCNDLTFGFS